MADVTKESFENMVDLLVNASPKSNVKGKPLITWIEDNFGLKARVSLTIGGALVNRVSEQFRYKAPVVIFVCKEDVNIESLISCIQDNAYPELEVMLLMSATKPYNYYHLYVCTSNAFSKWIEDNLTITSEAMTVENEIVNPQTEAEEATNVKDIKPSSKKIPSPKRSLPLQQIFYGAPGTGKSHTIKCEVEGKNLPHIRTTFHPDSDYSTFVGAYKPTTIDVPMRDVSGHIIVEGGNQVIEKKIIYTFVPQAFLKAYVAAWSNLNEPFFLIIEEINRGNCAQIFGDLFQLLDRNSDGISDYPVTSDDDIRRYLNSKFSALDDSQRANIPDEILSGEEMLLPQNFHIWATMNTSDQSLFPIDSAFKRRWDWKYTPIANGNKDWKIAADGKEYDWWQFLEKINAQIGDATNSEDKKLGYYFCKPINNQTIDAETFVSKVVFYLWNDVFKDFAEDAGSIFNDEDGTVLSFNKFYTTDTNGNAVVVEQKVTQFLQNLGVEALQDVE